MIFRSHPEYYHFRYTSIRLENIIGGPSIGNFAAAFRGVCARAFLVMTEKKRNRQQHNADTYVETIVQGFLALLEDQLKRSRQQTRQAAAAFKNGHVEDAVKSLRTAGKTMAHAHVSLNTALMLTDKTDVQP